MTGAKEIYEQQIDQVQHAEYSHTADLQAEEQFNSIRHCSKCKRNWSSLPVQDEEGDEQYEYCPCCNTDEYLTDYTGGDTFTFSLITGEIINDRTGKPEVVASTPSPEVSKPHVAYKQYEHRREVFETMDDKALAAYHKAFESGGQSAGEAAYWKVMKSDHI